MPGPFTLPHHTFRWAFLLAFTIFVAIPLARAAPDVSERLDSIPGTSKETDIAPGARRTFTVALEANQFAQITIAQHGIDLVTSVHDPKRQLVHKADWRWSGAETISWVARSAGEYTIEVSTVRSKGARGRLALTLSKLQQPPAQADAIWTEAEKALSELKDAVGRGATLAKLQAPIDRALDLWREVNHAPGVAQILNIRGFLENAAGKPLVALESYREALVLRSGKDRAGEAETLHNMAAAESATGAKQKARDLYVRTRELRTQERDIEGLPSTLSNLGLAHLTLGEVDDAFGVFDEAVRAARLVADARGEAQARNNLGALYISVGEPEAALDQLHAALDLAKGERDVRGEAYALANLGKRNIDFGDYPRALASLEQAAALMRVSEDKRGEGMTLTDIGVAYYLGREPKRAISYLDRSLAIFRGIPDRFSEGQTLQHLSRAYLALGQADVAKRYNGEALSIARSLMDIRGEAAMLRDLAEAEYLARDFVSAIDHLTQSRAIFDRTRQRDQEADVLLMFSRVYLDSGDSRSALTRIEDALKLIESQRSKVASSRLRVSYLASKRAYYDFYIDLLMKLDRERPDGRHAEAALEASERGRARLLLDTIPLSRINLSRAVEPALTNRKHALHRDINRLAYEIQRIQSGTVNEALLNMNLRLDSLLSELEDLQGRIFKLDPRYSELVSPSLLTVAGIQSQLDDETVLLEYHLGQEQSVVWAVTSASVHAFYDLPPRTKIEELVRRLYESVTARSHLVKGESVAQRNARLAAASATYRKTSAQLSDALLTRVAGFLSPKRLVIVADGALQFLPFGALPPPGAGRGTFLISNHEVVNLPSVFVLAALRRELAGRPRPTRKLAVIADPVYSPDDPRVAVPRTNGEHARERFADELINIPGDTRFPRLIHSRHEAIAILSLFPPESKKVVLDFDANLVSAMDPGLGAYQINHWATHGLLDSVRPSLSALILSLVDRNGEKKDGFLRLHEIYNLRLTADLVVLSACHTAMGKEIRGEGLVSLMRGFMYAGAPRVVASLWQVNDEATSELMKSFYQGMLGKSRLTPPAALRQAQLRMSADPRWNDPFYWAGFIAHGVW